MTATDPINTPVIREGEIEEIARQIYEWMPHILEASIGVRGPGCADYATWEQLGENVREKFRTKVDAILAILARHRQSEGVGSGPDVERAREIISSIAVSDMVGKCGWATYKQAKEGLAQALTALDRPQTDGGEDVTGALALIDELIAKPSSCEFHGINGVLKNKLLTIRMQLERTTPQTDGEAQTQPALELAREAVELMYAKRDKLSETEWSVCRRDVLSALRAGGDA